MIFGRKLFEGLDSMLGPATKFSRPRLQLGVLKLRSTVGLFNYNGYLETEGGGGVKFDHYGFRLGAVLFLDHRRSCLIKFEACTIAVIISLCFSVHIESTSDWVSGHYGKGKSQLMYAVFTTPMNSITGSAVCAFSLQDISDTFEGNYKEQTELNSNWLPVQSSKVRKVFLSMRTVFR